MFDREVGYATVQDNRGYPLSMIPIRVAEDHEIDIGQELLFESRDDEEFIRVYPGETENGDEQAE